MILKIVLIAIFFSRNISYVLKELETRPELGKFAGINNVPSDEDISKFLYQFSDEQFINLVLMVLNTISRPRGRGRARIVVDSTDIQVDLNWFRRKISKKSLEELRRRRVLRRGDTILMDKGCYGYQNYLLGVSCYQIVPLIFPKANFKLKRALNLLSYPLESYKNSGMKKD